MEPFFTVYLSLWGAACLLAVWLAFYWRAEFDLTGRSYRQFLFVHWKWVSFIIATTGMTVIAPYTGDPTWDYFDAIFMSVLTFYTAPWAVGTLYLWITGRKHIVYAYIALCCWLFSASWSYDLYILLRDGAYPHTWWSNMLLSSVLYASAGLMWNLEYQPGKGVIFGFMRPDWPVRPQEDRFTGVFWFALPFMVLAASLVLAFVVPVPGLSL